MQGCQLAFQQRADMAEQISSLKTRHDSRYHRCPWEGAEMKQIVLTLPGPLSPGAESAPSASPWAGRGTTSSTSSHPAPGCGERGPAHGGP